MNPDYKLADMLGIAAATIGLIIANGIVMGGVGAKYGAAVDRLRALAAELRGGSGSDGRKASLRNEISNYRRQAFLLNIGFLLMSVALLFFLFTVGMASLSVIFPQELWIRTGGTLTLFSGLVMIAAGTVCQVIEGAVERHDIAKEVADFPDLPAPQTALRR